MIGIIGAMDEEVAKIKENMTDVIIEKKAAMDFYVGKINNKDAVVVRSGIGKVNAGICTQILADMYNVDAIINTGIAGSLDADIDIGDIVLSEDALQHDMDAVAFGYPLGQIPRMDTLSFKADERLLNLVEKCCKEVCSDLNVFRGRVVSGDQFVASEEVKNRIKSNFNGLCTEMEGAAIAQAAYLNNIPFLVIRAISDKADNSAQVDYPTFEKKAIENSVKIIMAVFNSDI
ncbi:MAG: 5'-methylthioadenosine/adenosylhomocysteine nucleosidase [Lachnospiraceae bacterium]|nr:5'-methylthioadenosine/adenosylhomocysteine nucleosidase [Lachnospiraceae bacterium]